MSRMMKVYDPKTGNIVTSFRLPNKQQLADGHPTLNQMIRSINAKNYCVKSQLKEWMRIERTKLNPIAKSIITALKGG